METATRHPPVLGPVPLPALHSQPTAALLHCNAVNKWLKKDFVGLTAHCLRHTFRDRLRTVECPSDMIDQIGGWRSVDGVGTMYGEGYGLAQLRVWLARCSIY